MSELVEQMRHEAWRMRRKNRDKTGDVLEAGAGALEEAERVADGQEFLLSQVLTLGGALVSDWASLDDAERLDCLKRALSPALINPRPLSGAALAGLKAVGLAPTPVAETPEKPTPILKPSPMRPFPGDAPETTEGEG